MPPEVTILYCFHAYYDFAIWFYIRIFNITERSIITCCAIRRSATGVGEEGLNVLGQMSGSRSGGPVSGGGGRLSGHQPTTPTLTSSH